MLLLALLAFEKPPKLLSNALHDIKDMLVGLLIRFREELQDGLKLPLCVERKAEGSVEPMFSRIRFLGWLAVFEMFPIHSDFPLAHTLPGTPWPNSNTAPAVS